MAHPLAAQAQANVDGAEAGGMFSLSSPHGSATWLAILALLVIAFLVGRGRGIVGAIFSAFLFVGLVGAAQIVFGYLAHSYVLSHPEHPMAIGLEFNLSGV